jgi:hypothetical protein
MAQFIGASVSLRDDEYRDLRAKTSERPFRYLINQFSPYECPEELPYTCTFHQSTDTNTSSNLRMGHQEILRGAEKPYGSLSGPSAYQTGQRPWMQFQSTVEPGRHKYEQSVTDTSDYLTKFAVRDSKNVEPFVRGGASTRLCNDVTSLE